MAERAESPTVSGEGIKQPDRAATSPRVSNPSPELDSRNSTEASASNIQRAGPPPPSEEFMTAFKEAQRAANTGASVEDLRKIVADTLPKDSIGLKAAAGMPGDLLSEQRRTLEDSMTEMKMRIHPNMTAAEARASARAEIDNFTRDVAGGVAVPWGDEAIRLSEVFKSLKEGVDKLKEEESLTPEQERVIRTYREYNPKNVGINTLDKFARLWGSDYSTFRNARMRDLEQDTGMSEYQILSSRDPEILRTLYEIDEYARRRSNEHIALVVEEELANIEEDDTNPRQEDIAQLTAAINALFAEDRDFRAELSRRVAARTSAHIGAFAAKYLGPEQFSGIFSSFLGHHWTSLKDTAGVDVAVELNEGKDKYGTDGAYYRESEFTLKDEVLDDIEANPNRPVQQVIDQLLQDPRGELTEYQRNEIRSLTPSDIQVLKFFIDSLKPSDGFKSNKDRSNYYSAIKKQFWFAKHKYKLVQTYIDARDEVAQLEAIVNRTPEQDKKLKQQKVRIENLEEVKHLESFVGLIQQRDINSQKYEELIKISIFLLAQKGKRYSYKHLPGQVAEDMGSDDPRYIRWRELLRAIDPNTNQQLNPEHPASVEKKTIYSEFLYDLERAFAITERIHHITGMSAEYDGLRWKEKEIIPREFWNDQMHEEYNRTGILPRAGKNQLVELNPIMYLKDPDDRGANVEVNLRTAERDSSQDTEQGRRIYRALQFLRKTDGATKEIAVAWHKAKMDFSIKYYDQIDHEASISSSKSARMLARTMFYEATLGKKSEAHSAKAKYLRRFTEFGLMGVNKFLGFSSIKTMIDKGTLDEFYQNTKIGWAPRFKEVEKIKQVLIGGDFDFLRSTTNLTNPVDALKALKKACEKIFTTEERDYFINKWSRGLVIFNHRYSKDELKLYRNADLKELSNMMDRMRDGLMTEEVREDVIAKDLNFYYFKQIGKGVKAISNFVKGMINPDQRQRSAALKGVLDGIKEWGLDNLQRFKRNITYKWPNLFWFNLKILRKDLSFFGAIWEMFKQMVKESVPPAK